MSETSTATGELASAPAALPQTSDAPHDRGLAAQGRPPFRPSQEMRFAVVLYGGVSLAIYINGVVQELLELVRATAPELPSGHESERVLLGDHELGGSGQVYRRLGRLVGWGSRLDEDPGPEAPVRTRFVVDVVSGSSAGGINGAFLAKALANDESLRALRRLWVEEGEIASLVNDEQSVREAGGSASLSGLSLASPPTSALNSRRMYRQLLFAFRGMSDAGPGPAVVQGESTLVDELDLWLTATDLYGLELPIELADGVVYEKRYRNVFHFGYGTEYAVGSRRDDFGREVDPFLAYAARCTSAFPFAFEPMTLADTDDAADALGYGRVSDSERWQRYLSDYWRRARALGKAVEEAKPWRLTAFGDGGYLDNKPFSWATERLLRQRADLPVDRRLIYVEPDPALPPLLPAGAAPAWPQPPDRPDPLTNVMLAKTTLPRAETIREDIQRVLERNRELDRLDRMRRIADEPVLLDWQESSVDAWRDAVRRATTPEAAQYRAYHRLKLATVLDDLANLVTRLVGFDEASDEESAIRLLLGTWFDVTRERAQDTAAAAARAGGAEAAADQAAEEARKEARIDFEDRFLREFDVRFRLRRLKFVLGRLDDLMMGTRPPDAAEGWVTPGPADFGAYLETLGSVRRRVNGAFIDIRGSTRTLRSPTGSGDAQGDLRSLLTGLFSSGQVHDVLARRVEPKALLTEERLGGLDRARAVLAGVMEGVFSRATAAVDATLAPGDGAAARGDAVAAAIAYLRRLSERYEVYDAITLPFVYGVAEEATPVKVVRLSSQEGTALVNEVEEVQRSLDNPGYKPRKKLAGTSLHHFGGFFARAWRENDILWGRLDAAERIVRTVLGNEHPLAPQLVQDAQLAIVEEQFADMGEADARLILGAGAFAEGHPSPEAILEALRGHDVERVFARTGGAPFVQTITRAAAVSTGVLQGVRSHGLLKFVAGLAGTVGSLVGAALWIRRHRILVILLLALAAAGVGTLLGLGIATDTRPAARAGWTLVPYLALTVALFFLVNAVVRSKLEAPPPEPPAVEPPAVTPAQEASGSSAEPSPAAVIVLLALFLLLIFPLSLISPGISHVVSWLPGWR